MRLLAALVAFVLSMPASAINKCVDARGRVTFQDVPCKASERATEMRIRQETLSPSAPAAGESIADYEKGLKKRLALEDMDREIRRAEGEVARLTGARDSELAQLESSLQYARNAPHGAARERRIEGEIQSLKERYQRDIAAAQKALDELRKSRDKAAEK